MLAQRLGLVLCVAGCTAGEVECLDGAAVWETWPDGTFCVEGDLVVTQRTASDLERLKGLEEVTGSLLVQDNPDLVELPTFPALRRIGGSLTIAHNDVLAAVDGLPALEELSGELYIGDNPLLVRVTFASRPLAIGGLFIALNTSLAELRLPEVTEIAGDLSAVSNSHLQTLALPAVTRIGHDFVLADNPWLAVADFTELRTTSGWLLSNNDRLTTLAGFPSLADVAHATLADNDALSVIRWSAGVGTLLKIDHNEALERIEGEPVGDPFRLAIRDNPSLRAISAFSKIRTLVWIEISDNPMLTTLDAFAALESLAEQLSITGNASLAGPSDLLPTLGEVTGSLSIYGNSRLSPAIVDALLAHVRVDGTTRVGDNKDQMTELDPCPWPSDGVCDALMGLYAAGTGLCASDPEDCAPHQ